MSHSLRIVCLSDTHGLHEQIEVPDGDLLVHAGDVSGRGRMREIEAFGRWFARLPHRHKVLIAGNHDFLFQEDPALARKLVAHESVTYLEDEAAEIEGLRIWGSPWQPWFLDWAFNLERGEALRRVWDRIPDGTDLLLTHGPPHGVLDSVARDGSHVGCEELEARLRTDPVALHVFGHIHEGYGVHQRGDGRLSINASVCTVRYAPTNAPIVVDWTRGETPVVVNATSSA